jgi:hypothetical protein
MRKETQLLLSTIQSMYGIGLESSLCMHFTNITHARQHATELQRLLRPAFPRCITDTYGQRQNNPALVTLYNFSSRPQFPATGGW